MGEAAGLAFLELETCSSGTAGSVTALPHSQWRCNLEHSRLAAYC